MHSAIAIKACKSDPGGRGSLQNAVKEAASIAASPRNCSETQLGVAQQGQNEWHSNNGWTKSVA